MPGYRWFDCNSEETLSNAPCFSPPSTGCYCSAVTFANGCIDTACYAFIFSAIPDVVEDQILISPIPSDGTLDIRLSHKISLPVQWTLVDVWGRQLENGKLDQQLSTIPLKVVPPSGVYYFNILSAGNQTITTKLIIEAP